MAQDRPSDQKLLYTPGPLNTSTSVKGAMRLDWGSRDIYFMNVVKGIRESLLKIAGVTSDEYTAVLVQGAGTYAVESVLSSGIPKEGGKLVIFANGAYGDRMAVAAKYHGTDTVLVRSDEDGPVSLESVEKVLKETSGVVMVATVHGETSSGVINPVEEMGALVRKYAPGASYFVDAMSTFGGIPLNVAEAHIDFLVSSANKCLEGVPGFSYAIARKECLNKCKGQARSLSLDLFAQNEGLDKTGQFRFTPPTHAIVAFDQAVKEFWAEGGIEGRARRYKENNEIVVKAMTEMGFRLLVTGPARGYFITSFHYPKHPNFDFEQFYMQLNKRGFCIYPGKTTKADCFRIGNIGQLYADDMHAVVAAIREALGEMQIPTPVS
eukprot:comp21119_c0_seq1/m.28545 comp21119_c0_seq1/g.28545  ORF comp21119_c0_seq1/g.28545 comp21119_c0_seq1/m.28545 type:complete len:380 (-) comp21119_c0_seq1:158-1297(-)